MDRKEPGRKLEAKKTMRCNTTDRTLVALKQEGWEDGWSFHTRLPEQWNEAYDKATTMLRENWEVVLGQDEAERADGVAYLYKKRTTV